VFLFLAVAFTSLAQSGSIQGVVKDSSDAVIAGANVVVTNIDTGLRREVATNDQGFYTAPWLPVGRYKVGASKTGFAPAEVRAVAISICRLPRASRSPRSSGCSFARRRSMPPIRRISDFRRQTLTQRVSERLRARMNLAAFSSH